MSAKEMISLAALSLAVIVIFRLVRVIDAALDRNPEKFSITLDWKGILKFVMTLTGLKPLPPKPSSIRAGARRSRSWFVRRWRALLAVSTMALLIGMPMRWWRQQPEPWRSQVVNAWDVFVSVATHDPKAPIVAHLGGETRQQLTQIVKTYTNQLRQDPYSNVDIWVLDHYWQFWNTQNFDEYGDANKMFVASGGRIHRMFLLTASELQDPEVQAMLRRQCQIGKLTSGETGNGFELWRADPEAIRRQEEYQALSRSFRQLPEADRNFEDFNIIQFQNALYYTADFSPNHRALGSSVWLFNPDHVGKIDLKSLFRKSIAERISCDQPVLRAAGAVQSGE